MKNLINYIFIKIDKIINVYFNVFIIIINIIYFLIDIYFNYINFDFIIIIILFEDFIFLQRDIIIK